MEHRTRIIGVVVLAALAVLDSLVAQEVLAGELGALIREVVIYALPVLGLGAVADVVAVERRRRDPSVPALPDDTRGDS